MLSFVLLRLSLAISLTPARRHSLLFEAPLSKKTLEGFCIAQRGFSLFLRQLKDFVTFLIKEKDMCLAVGGQTALYNPVSPTAFQGFLCPLQIEPRTASLNDETHFRPHSRTNPNHQQQLPTKRSLQRVQMTSTGVLFVRQRSKRSDCEAAL